MATASRSLATALWGARFASGLLRLSYTTPGDTTVSVLDRLLRSCLLRRPETLDPARCRGMAGP